MKKNHVVFCFSDLSNETALNDKLIITNVTEQQGLKLPKEVN